jgi:hypothetical protein
MAVPKFHNVQFNPRHSMPLSPAASQPLESGINFSKFMQCALLLLIDDIHESGDRIGTIGSSERSCTGAGQPGDE